MCYYLSPAGLYEDWAAGVPSEYRADITERIPFFRSAHTISTTSRDLRKSVRGVQNQGWSTNDNAHCSLCIECSLASFIFWTGIPVFCPLLFMLSCFHPVCWPLSFLKTPSRPTSSIYQLKQFLSLSSLKQQLLGSPQVVSEHLHHHRHRCPRHCRQQTSLEEGSNRSSSATASYLYFILWTWSSMWTIKRVGDVKQILHALQIQRYAADILNTSLHSYRQIKW